MVRDLTSRLYPFPRCL